MPKLSSHPQAQDRIEQILIAHYERMVPDGLLDEMSRLLGGSESDLVEEAVLRHVQNTQVDSRGLPLGKYPPSIADVKSQIEQIEANRRRQRQQEETQKRQQESDAPYVQASKKFSWKNEIARGAAIRKALVTHLRLDPKKPEDMKLIMETLLLMQEVRGPDEIAEAVRVGQSLLEERAKKQTEAA